MQDIRPRPLAIIKLGDTFEALRERRGDFEHWVAAGLGASRLPVVVLDPRRGDTLPPPSQLSGAIVTGSHAMVSHREPWSEATAAWMRRLVEEGTPLLGICYGHQLLADALGGEAADHPQGIEVGTIEVVPTAAAHDDALLHGLPEPFAAQAAHLQSAIRLPEGAVPLAGNAFEAHQAFRIGPCAWGLQFHPEFDADVMRGYIDAMADELRAGGKDPVALADAVTGTATVAQLLGRFAHLAEEHDARRP